MSQAYTLWIYISRKVEKTQDVTPNSTCTANPSIPLSFIPFFSFTFFPPEFSPLRMGPTAVILSYAVSHLHEDTGKLRKIYDDTSWTLDQVCLQSIAVSINNDLPLKVSMCRPLMTGGHAFKYQPPWSCLTWMIAWNHACELVPPLFEIQLFFRVLSTFRIVLKFLIVFENISGI